MVISVSIMDTGYKRYMQIKEGQHKDETRDVLKLSVVDQYEYCYKNGMDIIKELFTGEILTEKLALINSWNLKTDYTPKRIECQKTIANTLYSHKKYYLD